MDGRGRERIDARRDEGCQEKSQVEAGLVVGCLVAAG